MHTPGEDMRIAHRRPDGSWLISDSLTPFRPAGVHEIDVQPSPSVSECSLSQQPSNEWEVKKVEYEIGYSSSMITLPPPAYTRHSYGDQSSLISVWHLLSSLFFLFSAGFARFADFFSSLGGFFFHSSWLGFGFHRSSNAHSPSSFFRYNLSMGFSLAVEDYITDLRLFSMYIISFCTNIVN